MKKILSLVLILAMVMCLFAGCGEEPTNPTTAGATVYINGGNFGAAPNHTQYTPIMGDGTVIITGGTFGFDPSNWVAEGYEAVLADGVWTVSAK